MDARGARHLAARLAAGAVGQRVEIVSAVVDAPEPIQPGQGGMVIAIGEEGARVLLDSGTEVVVDLEVLSARRTPGSRRPPP